MLRSFEGYLASLDSSQSAVARALCEIIRAAAPGAQEAIKWAQPVWEVNGPVCSIKAFKHYTNVNFWRGAALADLADQDHLLVGEGDQMRHVSVATIEDIHADSLTNLVQSAVELNRRLGNPTRREVARRPQAT